MTDHRNSTEDFSQIPKFGYALQSYEQILDGGFTYLVDARFNRNSD